MATGAELTYVRANATQMANTIFGDGVTVTGASYTGPQGSAAIYSNGGLAEGAVPSASGVILSTGSARSFTQSDGDPNRSAGTSADTAGINNNPLFNAAAGTNTYDAVWLDADFVPTGDTMSMRFVFSSEEYPEYINSQFNDVVSVWINGAQVPVSVGNGQISVNNINSDTQVNLAKGNLDDSYNTEMDGFTITLKLTIPVNPGVVNSIRIGITDTSDPLYDSNLMIAADSVQTRLVAMDDEITIRPNGSGTLAVLSNDKAMAGATLTITEINGVAVTVGSVITLPSGEQVKLNADGTLTIIGDGSTEQTVFTYTVVDDKNHIDTGIITLNSIPCFVAGTLIVTPDGERPVEALRPGDLVMTQDDGAQPLRWVGRRRVEATGAFAPVRIRAGTFGAHRDLVVSPQHRVLIRDTLAELLFGEAEVLVAAKDLIDGQAITLREGGMVDYVHLLFDRHQVVFSEGLATESFLPGPQTTQSFDLAVIAEICALFPELDPLTGRGYSPAARRTLRAYEARVLLGAVTSGVSKAA